MTADPVLVWVYTSGDWQHIFGAGGYTRNPSNPLTREVIDVVYGLRDIARVVATAEGENDGPDWIGVFEMRDGRFLTVRAGCDYTGWGCQEDGSSEVTATEAEAVACLTDEERARFAEVTGG